MPSRAFVRELDAVNVLVVIESTAVKVVSRQSSGMVLRRTNSGGAVLAKLVHACRFHGLRSQLLQDLESIRIRNGGFLLTTHDDGLKVLRSHHGTHAGASVGSVAHADEGGRAHHFFSSRADLQHLDALVLQREHGLPPV
jgi:hypothetical protein